MKDKRYQDGFPDAWRAGQQRGGQWLSRYPGKRVNRIGSFDRESSLRLIADQELVFMPGSSEAEAFIRGFVQRLKDGGA
jgi:hypothetical protein